MKNAVITILAFVYLGLAGGFVVNLHYCMGQLSSVEYGSAEHTQCEKCGMTEEDGCCNTELKVVKLQDSHEWANTGLLPCKYIATLPYTLNKRSVYTSLTHPIVKSGYYSPPDYRMNALYLHTSILRI